MPLPNSMNSSRYGSISNNNGVKHQLQLLLPPHSSIMNYDLSGNYRDAYQLMESSSSSSGSCQSTMRSKTFDTMKESRNKNENSSLRSQTRQRQLMHVSTGVEETKDNTNDDCDNTTVSTSPESHSSILSTFSFIMSDENLHEGIMYDDDNENDDNDYEVQHHVDCHSDFIPSLSLSLSIASSTSSSILSSLDDVCRHHHTRNNQYKGLVVDTDNDDHNMNHWTILRCDAFEEC